MQQENKKSEKLMELLLSRLLSLLKTRHTHYYLRRELDSHPYADTLYAIVEVLRGYGIKAFGIRNEGRDLRALSVPAVAVLRSDAQESARFAVVTDIMEDDIQYYIYIIRQHMPHRRISAMPGRAKPSSRKRVGIIKILHK